MRDKAGLLGNAADIYAYLRNRAEFTPYFGARSDSINSFDGLIGNDIDLASTLIAMLRSQGIKARYAQGQATLPTTQLANLLRLDSVDVLPVVLNNQGVVFTVSGSTMTIERTWVEALVPYRAYRGAAPGTCTVESTDCRWVALDPSFKQKRYAHPDKHLLLRNVGFDFTAYYNADNPTGAGYNANRKNKNPLTIFEEAAQAYLHANHPGVTLDDVADAGEIVADNSGLLPASLPYAANTANRYTSVDEHDASASNPWRRVATVTLEIAGCGDTGHVLPSIRIPLASLTSSRLTFGTQGSGALARFGFWLDGVQQGDTVTPGSQQVACTDGTSRTLDSGSNLKTTLTFDRADIGPNIVPISAVYSDLLAGGYFVVASGAEVANWNQVKRAYERLREASATYPLVVDSSGAVYVDGNGNGTADPVDALLGSHAQAREALVGGLLDVASRVYVIASRQSMDRYMLLTNRVNLMKASGGILSTEAAAQYLGETSFGVAPDGLIIDLKAYLTGGIFQREAPDEAPLAEYLLVGNMLSAHEHEVWQKVTGLDAISTVRGIQTSLAQGNALLTLQRDTLPATLGTIGFGSAPPSGYAAREYNLFGRRIHTWEYTGPDSAGARLDLIRSNPSGVAPDVLDRELDRFDVAWNLQPNLRYYDELENELIAAQTTETKLKKDIPFPPDGDFTVAGGYDLVAASVVNYPSDFSVRVSKPTSTTYRLYFTEKIDHGNASFDIVTRFYYALTGRTNYTISIAPQSYRFRLTSLTCSQPSVFSIVSPPTDIPYNTTVPVTIQRKNGSTVPDSDSFPVELRASGTAYTPSGAVAGSFSNLLLAATHLITRGNRVVDAISVPDVTVEGFDTSDVVSRTCNGLTLTGTPTQLLTSVRTQCFEPAFANAVDRLDFFDRNKGFDPNRYWLRDAGNLAVGEYPVSFLKSLQIDLYSFPAGRVEYTLPSRMPLSNGYLFNVFVRNEFKQDGTYKSSGFVIDNQNAD